MKEITLDDKIEYLVDKEIIDIKYKKKFPSYYNELTKGTVLRLHDKATRKGNRIFYIPLKDEKLLNIIFKKPESAKTWKNFLEFTFEGYYIGANVIFNYSPHENSTYKQHMKLVREKYEHKNKVIGIVMGLKAGIDKIYLEYKK